MSIFLYGLVESLKLEDLLITDRIVSDLLFSRMDLSLDLDMGEDDLSFWQAGDLLDYPFFLMM